MKKTYIFSAVFLIIGLGIGFFVGKNQDGGTSAIDNKGSGQTVNQEAVGVRQGGYRFINPLLECELGGGLESSLLKPFKQQIVEQVNKAETDKKAGHVSVYFRDLNNGPWFGINEDEGFTPASLLKLPVMITYLKEAEINPGILPNKLTLTEDLLSREADLRTGWLKVGESYTTADLIKWMIVKSDNDSFNLLINVINQDYIRQVHKDLGLPIPEAGTPEDFISVKQYASLFRVLYNASYLSRNMSESALKLLSEVEFAEGIKAGLPENTVLANKYGVRDNGNGQNQLHDCGIVYFPSRPYLLCIMTRGGEISNLQQVISDISGEVYRQVANNN